MRAQTRCLPFHPQGNPNPSGRFCQVGDYMLPTCTSFFQNQTNSLSKGPFCQKLPLSISILSSPDTHRACAISQGQTSSPVTATHGLDHPIKAKKYLVYCLHCGVLCCYVLMFQTDPFHRIHLLKISSFKAQGRW